MSRRLLASFAPLLAACVTSASLEWPAPRQPPSATAFAVVRRAWTRDASVVPISGLDNVLTLTATCLSPAFRSAYVARYARDYQLGPQERAALQRAQTTTGDRELQFFVSAYAGTDFEDADLSDPARGWRVLLVTAGGRWAPTSLEKIDRPSATQRAYFPGTHVQRMQFLIGFPPVVTPRDRWFRLQVLSAAGQARLEWRLGD